MTQMFLTLHNAQSQFADPWSTGIQDDCQYGKLYGVFNCKGGSLLPEFFAEATLSVLIMNGLLSYNPIEKQDIVRRHLTVLLPSHSMPGPSRSIDLRQQLAPALSMLVRKPGS